MVPLAPEYRDYAANTPNCGTGRGGPPLSPSEGFDPLATIEAIAEERCTAVYGVPTMFIAEMDHHDFAKFDFSSLRTGIMAGSPCPIEVMKRAVERMHLAEVTIGYGMTETNPASFVSSTDDPLERRVSTVGRVMPHIEVKIVDADGCIVPRGTSGELMTRGYSVMLGYWGDEEKSREAIDPAGWMRTGDLAALDDEGYCNIVGRIKDMVIRGGENIYPREIEEFLYRHPRIQDVQVIGVPDPHYGEELCAWIRLRDGEAAKRRAPRRSAPSAGNRSPTTKSPATLQNPPLHQVRRRLSDDSNRQDPEISDARADDRGTEPQRAGDGVRNCSSAAGAGDSAVRPLSVRIGRNILALGCVPDAAQTGRCGDVRAGTFL